VRASVFDVGSPTGLDGRSEDRALREALAKLQEGSFDDAVAEMLTHVLPLRKPEATP